MKCTRDKCTYEALFQDKRYPEICLCLDHATAFFDAFADWLWLGTPTALKRWLDVFNESGGKLK